MTENVIVKFKFINLKELINKRKSRQESKRLILKGTIVISTSKILKLIEEAEAATKNKKKGISKLCGKLYLKKLIVILKEAKDNKETSSIDVDDIDNVDDGED